MEFLRAYTFRSSSLHKQRIRTHPWNMRWHIKSSKHEFERPRTRHRRSYKINCPMQKFESSRFDRMQRNRWDGNVKSDQRILTPKRPSREANNRWTSTAWTAQTEQLRQNLWLFSCEHNEKLPNADSLRAEQMRKHDRLPVWSNHSSKSGSKVKVPWHQHDQKLQAWTPRGILKSEP